MTESAKAMYVKFEKWLHNQPYWLRDAAWRIYNSKPIEDAQIETYVDNSDLIRPNFVTEHFDIFLKKHGMRKIRFHDLRHTCASLLVALNENMKVIQAYMGHSTMSITADTYSHLDTRATSIAGMKLGSLIGNKDE